MSVWREAPMGKAIETKPDASLGDVFAVLLVIAGTWYVLDQALKAAEAKRAKDRDETGVEWADRVIREIDAAKAAAEAEQKAS